MQKAEQEIASLQASLARSETQVIRYKSTAEAAEKAETELKVERRKLQREVNLKIQIIIIFLIGETTEIINYAFEFYSHNLCKSSLFYYLISSQF